MIAIVHFGLVFFKSLVFMFFWGWFAVPFGLPPIGFFWALGINLGVGLLTLSSREILEEINQADEEKWRAIGLGYIVVAMAWLVGWIYHLLIGVC